MIDKSISHYRIVEKLGEGGMGVVYKAEDTKLERTIALKFLAEHLLSDPEAKERFLREAKAAAAISHPNICHVYEIDEADGKTFLAMEFVEGETLEDKIARGPLPIREALDIAQQVAKGLAAAHDKNIIHRDIKPANIQLTPDGRAAVMDFGLARLTESSRLTKNDTAMGTVAYMSPEQAQGQEVDHRTDIWALGCVLYEMVCGLRPFKGEYDQALFYEIVQQEPEPLTSVRAGVPMELEFIVGKCLAKDREDRSGAANELAREFRTLSDKLKSGRSAVVSAAGLSWGVPAAPAAPYTVNPAAALPPDAVVMPRSRQRTLYGLLAAAALFLLALGFVHFAEAPPAPKRPLRRFSFTPPPNLDTSPRGASLTISPDGRHLAYTTLGPDSGLWVQDLDQDEPRRLTTGSVVHPFWSPDSEHIAFGASEAGGRRELRKMSVQGGASSLISPFSGMLFQGTWSPNGQSIVFSAGVGGGDARCYEVSSQGGAPEELVTIADLEKLGTVDVSRPHFLSGTADRSVVFTVGGGNSSEMYAKNLDTGQTEALGPGDRPIYSAATGHLIYQSERNVYDLWARPFSPETLQFTGPAFPLRENARQPSLSDDGTLAFLDGASLARDRTLVWRDRSGKVLETLGQPQQGMVYPALSPNGQRVAVTSNDSGAADIWVHDLVRSTKTRLTFDEARERTAAWSSSGEEIVYWLAGANGSSLMKKSSDGTGKEVVLVEAQDNLPNPEWSRDGRYLVYQERTAETGYDIRYVEFEPDGSVSEPVTFLATPADEEGPKLSPAGRFVAYASDESGRIEIYVRPFPEGAGRWQASVEGGRNPRWSRHGSELLYVDASQLFSVSVSTGQGASFGQPQMLFQANELGFGNSGPMYDVSADGQRILTISPVGDAEPPKIRVVENWYEEFRNREHD